MKIAKRREDILILRLTPQFKLILKRAASFEHKMVSTFVLEKSLAATAETLADRREFRLPTRKYDAFVAAPDALAMVRPRLQKLMKSSSILQ